VEDSKSSPVAFQRRHLLLAMVVLVFAVGLRERRNHFASAREEVSGMAGDLLKDQCGDWREKGRFQ